MREISEFSLCSGLPGESPVTEWWAVFIWIWDRLWEFNYYYSDHFKIVIIHRKQKHSDMEPCMWVLPVPSSWHTLLNKWNIVWKCVKTPIIHTPIQNIVMVLDRWPSILSGGDRGLGVSATITTSIITTSMAVHRAVSSTVNCSVTVFACPSSGGCAYPAHFGLFF